MFLGVKEDDILFFGAFEDGQAWRTGEATVYESHEDQLVTNYGVFEYNRLLNSISTEESDNWKMFKTEKEMELYLYKCRTGRLDDLIIQYSANINELEKAIQEIEETKREITKEYDDNWGDA